MQGGGTPVPGTELVYVGSGKGGPLANRTASNVYDVPLQSRMSKFGEATMSGAKRLGQWATQDRKSKIALGGMGAAGALAGMYKTSAPTHWERNVTPITQTAIDSYKDIGRMAGKVAQRELPTLPQKIANNPVETALTAMGAPIPAALVYGGRQLLGGLESEAQKKEILAGLETAKKQYKELDSSAKKRIISLIKQNKDPDNIDQFFMEAVRQEFIKRSAK